MALTKELVILHGGRISLKSLTAEDSLEAHGSRFTVSIPLGHDHLPQAHIDPTPLVLFDHGLYSKGIVDEAIQWAQPHANYPDDPHSAMDNRSVSSGSNTSGTSTTASTKLEASTLFFSRADVILLVDDSTDLRRYVRGLLQPYCTIVESENGEDALRIMSAVRPNLVITDVMMPGMWSSTCSPYGACLIGCLQQHRLGRLRFDREVEGKAGYTFVAYHPAHGERNGGVAS